MELLSSRTKFPSERNFHPMELLSMGTKVLRDKSSAFFQNMLLVGNCSCLSIIKGKN